MALINSLFTATIPLFVSSTKNSPMTLPAQKPQNLVPNHGFGYRDKHEGRFCRCNKNETIVMDINNWSLGYI